MDRAARLYCWQHTVLMEPLRGNVDFQFPELVWAGKYDPARAVETPVAPTRNVFAINKYSGEQLITKNENSCRRLFY